MVKVEHIYINRNREDLKKIGKSKQLEGLKIAGFTW